MDLQRKIERILGKESTDELLEYIRQQVVSRAYIIYDSKCNRAVCTRCGEEWDIAPGEYAGYHNEKGYCLQCGEEIKFKSAGMGREQCTETFRVLHTFRQGKTAYALTLYCQAKFNDFGKPRILAEKKELFSWNSKEQHKYQYEWKWPTGKYKWIECKNIKITTPPSGSYGFLNPYYDIYMDSSRLKDLFTKTDMKYLWDEELIEGLSPERLVQYCTQGVKYKSIELLYKAGFNNLVQERLRGKGTSSIYLRGTSLQKILRLDMGDIRRIREHDPTSQELAVYQKLTDKEKKCLSWPLIKDMAAHWRGTADWLEPIEKHTSLLRFSEYITDQVNKSKMSGVNSARIAWIDYIETAEKLGMDTRRKNIIFPDNLRTAHDDVVSRYNAEKNKILDSKIQAFARIIDCSKDGLTIKTAVSQVDLNKESSELGHCVKTYGERLGNGKCRIYFIRHTDDPDTPFYTLETSPKGDFVQCRGNKNCSMTPEVKAFVDAFIIMLKKELKKEDKKCKKAA